MSKRCEDMSHTGREGLTMILWLVTVTAAMTFYLNLFVEWPSLPLGYLSVELQASARSEVTRDSIQV